jgi:hypothetical protein
MVNYSNYIRYFSHLPFLEVRKLQLILHSPISVLVITIFLLDILKQRRYLQRLEEPILYRAPEINYDQIIRYYFKIN